MAKLLATDLDGTLFYPKCLTRCISRRNVKFLRKWIDAGNKLVLISSRSMAFIEKLKEEIDRPFDIISTTSSHILADGKVIKDEHIDNTIIKDVLTNITAKHRPLAYLMTTKECPLVIKDDRSVSKILLIVYYIYWFFQFKYREPILIDNNKFNEQLHHGHIYKVMVFYGLRRRFKNVSMETNKIIRKDHPEIECAWTKIVNEITPLECNKGAGLKFYCDYLKIDASDVYVVGDSGNDITMFNLYNENSYAMAKSYPSVKKYAKHVIRRVYKLDKLVLAKEKNNE